MVKIRLWKVFLLLFNAIIGITASTHWVVTENGRIQAHLDSPFHLRRPYDLLAFLEQETRRTGIDILYQDLVSRKTLIDKKWSGLEGATDLESRIYSQDIDCIKAGKLLSEIDLYTSIAADGSDRDGIELSDFLVNNPNVDNTVNPNCMQTLPLDFSMFTFEHLSAMVNRENISVNPEQSLEQWLYPGTNLATFGHQVSIGLTKNKTSWLHHNLGAIYWRIRGNAFQAIECGRRAVYLAPREYRDIALLNMASIFHQARHPAEAAIILHAAIDHAPNQPANHFALGNVYAVLADYNRSVACYDNFLKLRPGLEQAVTTKHATLCHKKLESGLMELHESLQGILTELHDYHSQQQQWLRLQEKLMWEQAPLEAKLNLYNSEKLGAILANRGQRCGQRNTEPNSNSKPSISCDMNDSNQLATNLQVDITLSLQMLLRNVESQAQKISEQMARSKRDVKKAVQKKSDGSGDGDRRRDAGAGGDDVVKYVTSLNAENLVAEPVNSPPVLPPTYPTVMITQNADFDVTGWPTKQQCSGWSLPAMKNGGDVLPVFLPPENKGFQINKILTDYISLPIGSEHPLPWYPPVCDVPEAENDANEPYLPAVLMKQIANTPLEPHPVLLVQLKQYFGDAKIDEAEIGQRIITAMHKKAGPGWLLATLASLYWRVRSNTRNALNCLDLAFKSVPKEHADVILVSIGSVLHQLGFVEEALKVTTLAFTVNNVEPSTNFLLAMLQYAKNNPLLAIYHMKKVVRVDALYYDAQADLMLKAWACRVKTSDIIDDVIIGSGGGGGGGKDSDKGDGGMCAEKDSISAEGVFCTAGGEQCKTAAIQCYRADHVPEDAEIMTLNSRSMSKLLSSKQCSKNKIGLGHSLISTLLAAEGSGGVEPDQSQLESFSDGQQQAFHMRISLGDELAHSSSNTLGDFYVSVSVNDDPVPEAMLHVYDKSGTYPLSPRGCRDIRDADWLHFTSMWQSIAARNIDIGPFLKPLARDSKEELKPFCSVSEPPPSATLDYLTSIVLRQRLIQSPEPALEEWLGLMAGDQHSTLRDLGTQIGVAMRENTTSWILATAAALYWRVIGNTEQAVMCLRQALTYAPNDVRDIPLVSLANVLQRVGFHRHALEAAYMALESHPNFVVNHFTVGNIHTSLGDLEKAISFYRSSLALDANFEPARNRLQAILCTLLFDESGSLRESTDITEN